jgi:putative ABC transport system permease protein
LTIIGVVVFGPVIAKSAAGVIGSPLPRLRGVTGGLARQNAMRNPRRTSSTASALMVGVGVVTLFTVFAASLKASIDQSVASSFRGDLVVTAGSFGGGGLSPQLATDVAELPEVRTATGLGEGRALVGGDTEELSVVEPLDLGRVLDLDVREGSIAELDDRQLAVSDGVADDNDWRIGSPVPVSFIDGVSDQFTVGAIFDASDVIGSHVMSRDAWTPHAVQDIDDAVLIELRSGVDIEAGKRAVAGVAESYGAPDVMDADEYVDDVAGQVDMMLGLVYVLLALAIIIALMGIANTLSLSIHERTRELGLLRAVGESRRQLRSMIRWESVIIAIFGTTGGLALGVFLGWALVQAASEGGEELTTTFAAPVGQLIIVLVVGAVAGVLAGFRPARRAARLDVLRAIATE